MSYVPEALKGSRCGFILTNILARPVAIDLLPNSSPKFVSFLHLSRSSSTLRLHKKHVCYQARCHYYGSFHFLETEWCSGACHKSVYLSACLFVCLPLGLSFCLSVCVCVDRSVQNQDLSVVISGIYFKGSRSRFSWLWEKTDGWRAMIQDVRAKIPFRNRPSSASHVLLVCRIF